MNRNEIERLASAVSQLRPDWPVESLRSGITASLAHRSWRDAAVALAWVATDPETRTPGRVRQPGPWWDATNTTANSTPGTSSATRPGPRCQHCYRPWTHCQSKTVQTYDPHEFLAEVNVTRSSTPRPDNLTIRPQSPDIEEQDQP